MTARMRLAMVVSAAVCLFALTGCGAEAPSTPSQAPSTPSADTSEPVDLYGEITAANYTAWALAPGYSSPQTAKGPHGDEVQVLLDPIAAKAVTDGGTEWPVGAIIAKDIYRAGQLIQVAAMKKTAEGWYWGEWDAQGEPIAEGVRIEPCEGCHADGTDGTLGVTLSR